MGVAIAMKAGNSSGLIFRKATEILHRVGAGAAADHPSGSGTGEGIPITLGSRVPAEEAGQEPYPSQRVLPASRYATCCPGSEAALG